MRILYLSQYFLPEAGATQIRAYEMASAWVRRGHQVTMVSEVPNHPAGIIPAEYRGVFFQRDTLDGIEVLRVWVKTSPKKNFINRMAFYLSYMVNATLAGIFLARGRYDLIYASSPPLFVGAAALAIRKLKSIPFVFEVRDLWPESAVALGELSSKAAFQWATRLEEACYHRAEKIIVVTHGSYQSFLKRGLPKQKLELIPNGANTDVFCFSTEERDRIRQALGLEGKFVAIYAGILGIAQNLETLIEAAHILQAQSDIHFLLVGEGPKKAELLAKVTELELHNLTILPQQPPKGVPAYLSAADVALVPLRKIDLFKETVPSKLFDAWACERPVILGVDGEARRLLEDAQAGIFVPPEDPRAVASALIRLRDDPALCQSMGQNGRLVTVQNYSRQAQANKLAELLESKFVSAHR